jgi:glycerol-3-phosphate O-acyltransferase
LIPRPQLSSRQPSLSAALLRRILERKNMTQTRASAAAAQGAWSALQAFAQTSALQNQALVAIRRPENRKNRIQLVKSG